MLKSFHIFRDTDTLTSDELIGIEEFIKINLIIDFGEKFAMINI